MKYFKGNRIENCEDGTSTLLIQSKKYGEFLIKIDAEDVPLLSTYTFGINKQGNHFYARASNKKLLHKILLPETGVEVDHINRDTLDNRKMNLRVCSRGQNQANSFRRRANTYKGVAVEKRHPTLKFRAYIQVNHKKIGLGTYTTEVEAAIAYNQAALKYFGEFARLNEVSDLSSL